MNSLIVTKRSSVVAHGEKMSPIGFKSFRQGQPIIFFISSVICSVYNAVVFVMPILLQRLHQRIEYDPIEYHVTL